MIRGFGKTEWTSLQNLHRSEKRNSPRDIGRFGMGSRSYFHYADTLLVVSNGQYVGIDPLRTTSGQRSGGWSYRIDSEKLPELGGEVDKLFQGMVLASGKGTGATFRLPLRRAEDCGDDDDDLGRPIDRASAESLLKDWAESLHDGRLLLFLSSVEHVSVRRWDDGDPGPTVVAEVFKRFDAGEMAFPRLPPQIPSMAVETFGTLQTYVVALTPV